MKIFAVHNNYKYPFLVKVRGKHVTIYKNPDIHVAAPTLHPNNIIYNNEVTDIFIGPNRHYRNKHMIPASDVDRVKARGNSILIEESPLQYLFIGWQMFRFKTSEPIIRYYSPIGNNDVPYPYAMTANNTYLMLEHKVIYNDARTTADPYDQLYGWIFPKKERKAQSSHFRNFKYKLIM